MYPVYELLKRKVARALHPEDSKKRLAAGPAAVCGSIAGGFAGAVTTPLDVLKTRIMLDSSVSTMHSVRMLLLIHYFSPSLQDSLTTSGRFMRLEV